MLAKRKKAARPVRVSNKPETYYRSQLNSLIRAMNLAIEREVMPVVKQEKPEYTGDSTPTMDAWSERIIAALQAASEAFVTEAFEAQARRIAVGTVSMADAESTQAFLKSVNRAVGVDLSAMIQAEGIADYVDASVAQNVNLIKSVRDQYLAQVQSAVLEGMRAGDAPSSIAKRIQQESGVSRRRAKLIARDQVAKLNSDITEKRQSAAGVTHYRWVTSKDQRVSGAPSGKYPNAKIKCYEIARKDVGNGPGVYSWKEGASYAGQTNLHPGRAHVGCRCTSTPVFSWELENQ